MAVSPSGWAIRCMAVAAAHRGALSGWPRTEQDVSTSETSRSTRGRRRHLGTSSTENVFEPTGINEQIGLFMTNCGHKQARITHLLAWKIAKNVDIIIIVSCTWRHFVRSRYISRRHSSAHCTRLLIKRACFTICI